MYPVSFLKEFVEGREDMVLAGTYSDFGYTGTNYERPGFLRLMEDAKREKIDCIVVKDLSRLGRNYIETGNLIENVFSFLDIRLVAVTDGFDTGKGDGMGVMVASIKNLVNDVYSRDISRKIISVFRTKQRNRAYIGDMVQGKGRQELCNNIPKHHTDRSEWIMAEGTHEPVVDRELFFRAQGILEERQREQAERRERSRISEHKEENYLKGYMRCGHCGKTFNLSQTMRNGKVTRGITAGDTRRCGLPSVRIRISCCGRSFLGGRRRWGWKGNGCSGNGKRAGGRPRGRRRRNGLGSGWRQRGWTGGWRSVLWKRCVFLRAGGWKRPF